MSSDRTNLVASPARDGTAAPETDAAERGDRGASGRRQQVARGTLINGAFNVGLDTLGLIRSFAIAAFLTTSEYGILGMLVIALGTLGLLKQVGIVDKYVQQDEPDQQLAFQKAFTLELLALSGLAVITVAAVPLLALVYGRSELVAPGLLVAAFIPVVAFYAPTWVFYRRLDFVRQRALLAVEPITMFIVSVGLAAAGFGYWSLVWGAIAGGCLAALASVLASPYPLAL